MKKTIKVEISRDEKIGTWLAVLGALVSVATSLAIVLPIWQSHN
jgi:hypothetical protein